MVGGGGELEGQGMLIALSATLLVLPSGGSRFSPRASCLRRPPLSALRLSCLSLLFASLLAFALLFVLAFIASLFSIISERIHCLNIRSRA